MATKYDTKELEAVRQKYLSQCGGRGSTAAPEFETLTQLALFNSDNDPKKFEMSLQKAMTAFSGGDKEIDPLFTLHLMNMPNKSGSCSV